MDVISNLGLGFAVALTLQNTAYCFIGVLLGTVIGVLPGIGPVTTVAMLLPISFTLQPEAARGNGGLPTQGSMRNRRSRGPSSRSTRW